MTRYDDVVPKFPTARGMGEASAPEERARARRPRAASYFENRLPCTHLSTACATRTALQRGSSPAASALRDSEGKVSIDGRLYTDIPRAKRRQRPNFKEQNES